MREGGKGVFVCLGVGANDAGETDSRAMVGGRCVRRSVSIFFVHELLKSRSL